MWYNEVSGRTFVYYDDGSSQQWVEFGVPPNGSKIALASYADSAARTTALPSPSEADLSYLQDTNSVEVYDGSSWVRISGDVNEFTPVWNNITVGNATTAGWWTTIGDIAIVYAYIQFGSTSAMSTNPFLPIGTNGLPFPSTYGEFHYISDVILEEVGVQTLRGLLKWRDGNIAPVTTLTSGTYLNQANISATVPFTWGTGDFLSILTMYRRA